MTNYIYKSLTDLEAASKLLTKVLDSVNESVQRYEKRNDFPSQAFYKKESERYSVYRKCKDNLDFVITVLKNYLDAHPEESSGYTPRRITSIYDIGKYQSETLKAKRNINSILLWRARISGDEEGMKLYQECIEKLNFVYSHIAKNK